MPDQSKKGMACALVGVGTVDTEDGKILANYKILHRLVKDMGNDSETFGPALSLTATSMYWVNRLNEEIMQEGPSYVTETLNGEQRKINPKMTAMNTHMTFLKGMLSEFGLTPASIQKVGGAKKEEKSSFSEFINV